MIKVEGADIIAIVLIIILGSLIAVGRNSVVTASLLTVTAYYFGHKRIKPSELA